MSGMQLKDSAQISSFEEVVGSLARTKNPSSLFFPDNGLAGTHQNYVSGPEIGGAIGDHVS